jgi:hypothetical protein
MRCHFILQIWLGEDDLGILFRSEPRAAEPRRLARRESGRVCQRVLIIANMLGGMGHEEAARLPGLSRREPPMGLRSIFCIGRSAS